MMHDQMANIPRFPRVLRKSWPMGSGRSVARMSNTEVVAKDAAMYSSHPRPAVAPAATMIAMGAARAAPEVSSAIWAAESSA